MSFETSAVGVKLVASGLCLSRIETGEIVFVSGLLPGETAIIEETKTKGRTKFGEVVSLLNRSPDRIEPSCKYVESGCGGCDWQHIDEKSQLRYKRDIVVDAFSRVGKIQDSEAIVEPAIKMATQRYRTTARILADAKQWGFRKVHSHEIVPVQDCLVLHKECVMQAGEVVKTISVADPGNIGEISEASVRRAPDTFRGVALSLSPKSFFQSNIEAPKVLTDLILENIEPLGKNLFCVDLYSGVGIFALALTQAGHKVIAVEGNLHAVGDANRNLEGLDATVVHCDVKKFRFENNLYDKRCDVVVADPSREGLSKDGVASVISCAPRCVILISCDPPAGARDVSLLRDAGFNLEKVIPVDMFGFTHHVEVVSVLTKQ